MPDRNPEGVEAAARAMHDEDIREQAVEMSYPECADYYRGRASLALAAYQSTIHESSETLLGEIEARLAKATGGDWRLEQRQDAQLIVRTTDADVCQVFTDDLNGNPAEDAEFIAHAPSDIRALLDIIRSGGEGS